MVHSNKGSLLNEYFIVADKDRPQNSIVTSDKNGFRSSYSAYNYRGGRKKEYCMRSDRKQLLSSLEKQRTLQPY